MNEWTMFVNETKKNLPKTKCIWLFWTGRLMYPVCNHHTDRFWEKKKWKKEKELLIMNRTENSLITATVFLLLIMVFWFFYWLVPNIQSTKKKHWWLSLAIINSCIFQSMVIPVTIMYNHYYHLKTFYECLGRVISYPEINFNHICCCYWSNFLDLIYQNI